MILYSIRYNNIKFNEIVMLIVCMWGINHKIINTYNQTLKLEYLHDNFIF